MRVFTALALVLMTSCTAMQEAKERSDLARQEQEQHLRDLREMVCSRPGSCTTRTVHFQIYVPGVGQTYGSARVRK